MCFIVKYSVHSIGRGEGRRSKPNEEAFLERAATCSRYSTKSRKSARFRAPISSSCDEWAYIRNSAPLSHLVSLEPRKDREERSRSDKKIYFLRKSSNYPTKHIKQVLLKSIIMSSNS